jgi:hypothetical protein
LFLHVPADQLVEGRRFGVGLGGDPVVDHGQNITRIQALECPLDTLRLLGLVVVDLIGGGDVDIIH